MIESIGGRKMKTRMKIGWLVLLWFVVLPALNSPLPAGTNETGAIEGRVINKQTGEPIANANILIHGTYIGAASDQQGKFLIEKVKPGKYLLVCSAIGFRKQELSITIAKGQKNVVEFVLEQTALQLRDIVVTASKFNQAIEDVPVTIHVLRPEDIAIRNSISLDQALQYIPGVQTAGNNISIRGSTGFSAGLGTRALILLDGVPFLSGDEGSADFSAVPAAEIEQVEVMKGAGSALYGSSAMGGVINIITKKPDPDTSHIRLSLYSGIYSQPSYPQWQWSDRRKMFRGTSLHLITTILGIASSISANYHKNDSFKENADFYNWNLYGKFRLQLNPGNNWLIQTGWLDSNSGGFIYWKDINHALQSGSDPPDRYSRTDSKIFYLNSVMTQTLSSRFYYRLRFNLQRNHAQDSETARPGMVPSSIGVIRESYAKVFGHELQFGYQPDIQHNITFGWELNLNRVQAIHYGRRQIANGSLYLQYSLQPKHNLKIDIGGRWDGERGEEITPISQFNPKFGINYQIWEDNMWRFSAGRGFRTPTIAERFISTFSNQILVKPNHKLKPERNVSVETGLRRNFNSFGYLDVCYFLNDFSNLIDPQLQPNEAAVRFENITRARIHGLEVAQQSSFLNNQLAINLAYTYLHARDLSRTFYGAPNPDYNKPLKYRPSHLFTARGQYQLRNWICGIDFRYISKVQRVDRLTNIPDLEKQVPAYVTDLQAGIQKVDYSLMVIVNNVFQYYYFISPGNLGDLRNYSVQFTWNFR